ncbi:hypothetical protein D3C73_1628290 [compost metagenome]
MRFSSEINYNVKTLPNKLIHLLNIGNVRFNEGMIGVTLDRLQIFQIPSVSKCVHINNLIIRMLLQHI